MSYPPPSPSTASRDVPLTPLEGWISTKIGMPGSQLDLEALPAFQLEKLNQTLALVQSRSAFYRRQLASRIPPFPPNRLTPPRIAEVMMMNS